jgi:hypothetical protein
MKISIEHVIKEGDIRPLRWGMSAAELAELLPGNPEFHWGSGRTGSQGLLDVDGLEFHFFGRRQDLYLLVVKVWKLAYLPPSRCWDFGWLHPELTLGQLRRQLDGLGWPYETMHDPLNPGHPLLVLGRRAWCLFDDTDGPADERRLQKISLQGPDDGQALRSYARLRPVTT